MYVGTISPEGVLSSKSVNFMTAKERVELEKKELDEKIKKLEASLDNESDKPQERLKRTQAKAMQTYSSLLGMRLRVWED